MNLLYLAILVLCGLNNLTASTYFNPLKSPNGKPHLWSGVTRQGIIGWLDVPAHVIHHKGTYKVIEANRILALQNGSDIQFIHPCNPDIVLPDGLYCWQTDWKNFTSKKETGYRGLHADPILFEKYWKEKKLDAPLRNCPISEKWHYNESKLCWGRFAYNRAQFTPYEPSMGILRYGSQFPTEQYIQTDARHCQDHFYNIMGVTEYYLREFLGAHPDQFEHEVHHRNELKINNPCAHHVRHYFPPKSELEELCSFIHTASCAEITKKIKKSNRIGALKITENLDLNELNGPHTAVHVLGCFDGHVLDLADAKKLLSEIDLSVHDHIPLELHIARKYYHEPINLLSNLSKKITHKKGLITKVDDSFCQQDCQEIKVAWCTNCTHNTYIITAVPCTTKKAASLTDKHVQLFLKCAYESAIKTAHYLGKKKLICNIAQAQAYGYSSDQIAEILISPEIINYIKDSGVDVIVPAAQITEKYKKILVQQ
jgi:hypothetical protein